jgi:hypothetical protein
LLINIEVSLTRRSSRCIAEVRAIVPVAKGTEVFYSNSPTLRSRADRRKELEDAHGFVCHCELCTLPDHLSNALDSKIFAAIEANRYIMLMFGGMYNDYVNVARCVETLITTITEERMLSVQHLMTPILFFAFFHKRRLVKMVGQVVLSVFERYWGPGQEKGEQPAINLSRMLENPPDWHSGERERRRVSNLGEVFNARLDEVASNIIASLKRLP